MWRKYSHVGNITFFEEPDSGINDLFLLAPSTGLEPVTYRLGGDCSILLSYEGGELVEQRGDRTPHVRIANPTAALRFFFSIG